MIYIYIYSIYDIYADIDTYMHIHTYTESYTYIISCTYTIIYAQRKLGRHNDRQWNQLLFVLICACSMCHHPGPGKESTMWGFKKPQNRVLKRTSTLISMWKCSPSFHLKEGQDLE